MSDQSDDPCILTIITPVLNGCSTIAQTIESTDYLKSFQIQHIVIDGGSSDGTQELVSRFKNCTLLHQTSQGLSSALNDAIKHALGQYIVVLNSDDYLLPSIISIVQHLAQHIDIPSIVYADIYQQDPNSNRSIECKADIALMHKYMSVYHPALFVPRSIYRDFGFYDPHFKLAMDSEFVLRCLAGGVQFKYLPKFAATMRLGGKSHINTFAAMEEYEQALLMHNIQTPTKARWYRIRQTLFHELFKHAAFQRFWMRRQIIINAYKRTFRKKSH